MPKNSLAQSDIDFTIIDGLEALPEVAAAIRQRGTLRAHLAEAHRQALQANETYRTLRYALSGPVPFAEAEQSGENPLVTEAREALATALSAESIAQAALRGAELDILTAKNEALLRNVAALKAQLVVPVLTVLEGLEAAAKLERFTGKKLMTSYGDAAIQTARLVGYLRRVVDNVEGLG